MPVRASGIALAVFGVTAVTPAAATTIAPAGFAEMASESPVIVHGRVEAVRSQTVGGHRTIESLVTLRVIEALKGEPAASIVFRVPAGRVGRYRRVMVGAPEFHVGDEVVVFLAGQAPRLPTPFGLNQGVYRVSGPGGRRLVTPLVPAEGRLVRGDPARRPLSIEAFARAVQAAAGSRP
jgi:hypothetical protein